MSKKQRLWYNTKMAQVKVIEFNEKFNEFNKEILLETIKTCDFKTLRLICNALDKSSYSEFPTIFKDIPYAETKIIRDALNTRVNEILGEYAELYDKLMKSQKHELWCGDERYKLFGYDLPPYADRQVIKSLVKMVCEYIGKPLTIENISGITSLYNHGLYWEIVPSIPLNECRDWETNDKHFATQNNNRQSECEAWYTFMNHIYNGDYEKAYALMKRYGADKR